MATLIILVACTENEGVSNKHLLDLGQQIVRLAQTNAPGAASDGVFTDTIRFFRPDTTPGRKTIDTLAAGISSTATWTPAQIALLHELEEISMENLRAATDKILGAEKIAVVVAAPNYLVAWINHYRSLTGTGPKMRYLLADNQTAISVNPPDTQLQITAS